MKHYESNAKFYYSILVLFMTSAISESVKAFVNRSEYNIWISLGFVSVAILILTLVNYFINKRIDSGKGGKSIAIRSSKIISDFYKSVRKISKTKKWDEEKDSVLMNFSSISRHLLLIGEYRVRFRIGKIIVKKTSDPVEKMSAYADELGWTSVMMGKTNAVKYFKKALEIANPQFTQVHDQLTLTSPLNDDIQIKKMYLASRVYRHIASNSLIKDMKIRIDASLQGKCIIDTLMKIESLPSFLSRRKLDEMMAGLDYGLGEIHLTKVHKSTTMNLPDQIMTLLQAQKYNILAKNLAKTFDNKHRYIKTLLIENEIFKYRKKLNLSDSDYHVKGIDASVTKSLKEFNWSHYSENLKIVEEAFNNSLYIDEAYEIFLDEKIKKTVEVDEQA